MKQQLLTFLLAIMAGIGTMNAEIYSGTCGENLTWQLNSVDSTLTISGSGAMTDFPTFRSAPWYNYGVSRVNLPDGLTHIGDFAFVSKMIKSVVIPNTVVSIGDAAFRQCALEHITIPDNVVSIGGSAFWECAKLETVHLGSNLQSIGGNAFMFCYKLETINFPESITYVGSGAFYETKISHPLYNSTVFAYLQPSYTGKYRIPNGIKLICGSHVGSPHLSALFIPSSVEQMEVNAYQCDTLFIEDLQAWFNIDFIGGELANPLYTAKHFYLNNQEITSLIVPENITRIKNYSLAQKNSAIKNIIINDNVTYIGLGACVSGGLESLVVGEKVDTIENSALGATGGIKNIVWKPIHCKKCSWSGWYGPFETFGRTVNSFTFGDKVKYIPEWLCHEMENVHEFILPDSLETIAESAFWGCTGLDSITIPQNVNKIHKYAFASCSNLRKVNIKSITPPILEYGSFPMENDTLIVPCGTLNAYMQSSWAQYFAEIIEDQPFSVEVISAQPEMGTVQVLAVDCENQTAHIVATPEEGYKFTGWSDGNMESDRILPLTQDINLTASFEIQRFEITFAYADGTPIDSRWWDYGATPTCEEPILVNTAQYTFVFLGWEPEIVPAYDDAIYIAHIDTIINEYLVTFYNDNDTILDAQRWQYGSMPICVEPTKMNNAQWNYTFAGWTPEIQIVTGEATYKAQYDSLLREYTVTFQWADGTPINRQLWDYGTTPSCAIPTLQNTAQYTFTFLGWTPEIESVTGDAVYTAIIDSALNYYSVLFLDWDGTELSEEQVIAYGSAAQEPILPTREGYVFRGWSKDVTFITGKTYAVALYEKEQNAIIEVVYEDGVDGSEIFKENIMLNTPSAPFHTGYTFVNWLVVTNDLTDGIIIRAVYHDDNDTTPTEQIEHTNNSPQKVIRDGNVLILRSDRTYTVTGQELR